MCLDLHGVRPRCTGRQAAAQGGACWSDADQRAWDAAWVAKPDGPLSEADQKAWTEAWAAAKAAEVPPKPGDSLTEADRKAIAWFDTLGLPDLAKKPCLCVSTGYWSQSGNNPPVKIDQSRISAGGNTGRVHRAHGHAGAHNADLPADSARRAGISRVGYSVIDLKELAAAENAYLDKPDDKYELWSRFGATWGPPSCFCWLGPARPTGWNLWPTT